MILGRFEKCDVLYVCCKPEPLKLSLLRCGICSAIVSEYGLLRNLAYAVGWTIPKFVLYRSLAYPPLCKCRARPHDQVVEQACRYATVRNVALHTCVCRAFAWCKVVIAS